MGKKIRLTIFKWETEYRMTVYIDNAYYTEHREKDPKKLLLDAHEYLTADL